MDGLEDYRARHRQQYLQRENALAKAREVEELAALEIKKKEEEAELERLRQLQQVEDAFGNISALITNVCLQTTIEQIRDTVTIIRDTVTEQQEILSQDKTRFTQLGLNLLEVINNNEHTKTNFNNPHQVIVSKSIQNAVKTVLSACGVIIGDEDLEVDFDMDCSRDAEMARQLAEQLNSRPVPRTRATAPPRPPRIRGSVRPRTAAAVAEAATVAIPEAAAAAVAEAATVAVPEAAAAVPEAAVAAPVRRPRGRPRRNPQNTE